MISQQEYMEIYDIVGVAIEVYNTIGYGMAEPIYQEAFAVEMKLQGMNVEREKQLKLYYKDVLLNKTYYADFYYNGIVIELKAVEKIISDHRAQLFNYMRISKQRKGILINFGERSLRAERYVYDEESDHFILLNRDNYKEYIILNNDIIM
ncbi:MAG: GxxExxY protein [Prevotella sp.]|nr:GxxExxY protein [Prevotella sp.]